MPVDWAIVVKVGSYLLGSFAWVKRKLSMCSASIESKWKNGTDEAGVVWIHIPVTVKPGWLGAHPVIDAEIDIIEAPKGIKCPMPLFWQNRADADKPARKMTLRPGNYVIPFAARTTRESFPLSASAVTLVPDNLWESWLLKKGIVRITDQTHYFTFTGLTNLTRPDLYKFTVCIKNQAGKAITERSIILAVPEIGAGNKGFYYVCAPHNP